MAPTEILVGFYVFFEKRALKLMSGAQRGSTLLAGQMTQF
jgi:hypothetical protein